MKYQSTPYLPAMFATCMLFQVLYVACVGLWFLFPDLKGHEILTAIFPGFKLLDLVDFLYGFIMSAIYGWVVAVVFVFFYNMFPKIARVILHDRQSTAVPPCCGDKKAAS
jgi:hypothetical protein